MYHEPWTCAASDGWESIQWWYPSWQSSWDSTVSIWHNRLGSKLVGVKQLKASRAATNHDEPIPWSTEPQVFTWSPNLSLHRLVPVLFAKSAEACKTNLTLGKHQLWRSQAALPFSKLVTKLVTAALAIQTSQKKNEPRYWYCLVYGNSHNGLQCEEWTSWAIHSI